MKEFASVISERDILGGQLVKRSEEVAALYEKIKIRKSALAKSEDEYFARKTEIENLYSLLEKSTKKLHDSKSKVEDVKDLRYKIFGLEKQLLRERMKSNALRDELSRPLNVHRWRKLEGSDPHRFALIKKIQNLQKRLIEKVEQVSRKDASIQRHEKLYVEIKNILARQPGPEVAEQLSLYQKNLKDKGRQMQAMKTELKMYKSQVNEHKFDIERLSDEMKAMKKRYFQKMRASGDFENRGSADDVAAGEPANEGMMMSLEGAPATPSTEYKMNL